MTSAPNNVSAASISLECRTSAVSITVGRELKISDIGWAPVV